MKTSSISSILVFFLITHSSLFAWKGENFEALIKKYEFPFSFNQEFQKIETKENPELYYDFAIKHKSKKLEIRYLIGSPPPESEKTNLEKNEYYKHQAITTAANVCQCMDSIEQTDLTKDALSAFNADWGANFIVGVNSKFGEGYKFAIITALHKKDYPDLYTIYLFDDIDSIREELKNSIFNIRFKNESILYKNFRGIKFYPTVEHTIKDMKISIPSMAERRDTIQQQDKYPISFFKVDCQNENECFSLLITVSIIPDSLKSYEDLVKESKTNDFGNPPNEMKKWIEILKFKTDKTTILFGNGKLLGNQLIGFYHWKQGKETYQVSIQYFFHPTFSDNDWKDLVTNGYLILDSISIQNDKSKTTTKQK
ncbi:hypothetical protein AB3N60_05135 [Leptospira sp. WS39.C2]